MQRDMLDAKKILPALQAPRHGDALRRLVGARPRQLRPEVRLLLVHLEPDAPAAVPRLGRLALGHAGHVHLHWTGMVDVGARREADRRARRDVDGRRAAHREGVASDSFRLDVADEAVVLPVGCLDHVYPLARGFAAG